MLKISLVNKALTFKEGEKEFSISFNPQPASLGNRVFFSFAAAGIVFKRNFHYSEIVVNDAVFDSAAETASAITVLSSVFNLGGGTCPQPSPNNWQWVNDIFEADPDPNKRFILVFTDSIPSVVLNRQSLGNATAYFKTSDGATYDGSQPVNHVWDNSKDIEGYGFYFRYVTVYSIDKNVICDGGANLTVKYARFGNGAIIDSILFQMQYLLEGVGFENAKITKINDNAFHSCLMLNSFVVPNGVTSIGNSAFESCFLLHKLFIPKSVTSVAYKAFTGCTLIRVEIEDGWVAPALNFLQETDFMFFPESAAKHFFTKLGSTTTPTMLQFGYHLLERWSSETKAIATNKGYSLS